MLPASHDSWPSQDGIDRSDSLGVIGILTLSKSAVLRSLSPKMIQLKAQFREKLEEAVNESVRETIDRDDLPMLRAERYEVGPAADGLFSFEIITLWDHRHDLALALALLDSRTVALICRKTVVRLHNWLRESGEPQVELSLSFPPEVLTRLCEDHVRSTYHPRAELTSKWYSITQETYAGYISPAHPSGNIEYVIIVSGARTEYLYRINGEGEVLAHNWRAGKRSGPLDPPNLLPSFQSNGKAI